MLPDVEEPATTNYHDLLTLDLAPSRNPSRAKSRDRKSAKSVSTVKNTSRNRANLSVTNGSNVGVKPEIKIKVSDESYLSVPQTENSLKPQTPGFYYNGSSPQDGVSHIYDFQLQVLPEVEKADTALYSSALISWFEVTNSLVAEFLVAKIVMISDWLKTKRFHWLLLFTGTEHFGSEFVRRKASER